MGAFSIAAALATAVQAVALIALGVLQVRRARAVSHPAPPHRPTVTPDTGSGWATR
jgi:hypothetical protein